LNLNKKDKLKKKVIGILQCNENKLITTKIKKQKCRLKIKEKNEEVEKSKKLKM